MIVQRLGLLDFCYKIHIIWDQDLWGIYANINNYFGLFATYFFRNSNSAKVCLIHLLPNHKSFVKKLDSLRSALLSHWPFLAIFRESPVRVRHCICIIQALHSTQWPILSTFCPKITRPFLIARLAWNDPRNNFVVIIVVKLSVYRLLKS